MNAWTGDEDVVGCDCERALEASEWMAGLLIFALFVAIVAVGGWITGGPM